MVAQRARKTERVRALHAKVKNSRKDQLHNLSTALVEEYGAIFIGNENASALTRIRMAESVLDAGWSLFRTMLQYKSDVVSVWFDEVDEAYSTRTCSRCNRRTGPNGLEGLGTREWACLECGAYHHRDINAAENICAAGCRRLAVGIPVRPAPCAAAAG
ncbi:RNA-guided endonuclease InsQ/TnpB family protein [Paraburkholderia pallida]|uniref:RNA-guided endonuclease InsQ/TnpB family protein n=1 Tax=Paraburkholderia pallida TaxID=2547399 RepID=UPI001E3C1FD0|nr:transposase [Paraburkholderia pallida]